MKHTSLWLVVEPTHPTWLNGGSSSYLFPLKSRVPFKKVLPSCHNHLSKALTPNIILLDVMILTYEFGDDKL